MKKLDEIDKWILNICTKFAHWLQKTTGLTNYFVAKIGIGITSLSILCAIGNYFNRYLSKETSMLQIIIGCTLIPYGIYITNLLSKAEENFDSTEKTIPTIKMMSNLFMSSSTRMFWLFFCFWDLWVMIQLLFYDKHYKFLVLEIIKELYSIGSCIFFYFIAVNPLPPGKNKIREWLEQFSFKQLEPVPVPIPKD